MNKFFVLLKQVYKQKIQSKPLIFTTLLYFVAIIGVSFWPEISRLFKDDKADTDKIAIINKTDIAIETYFLSDENTSYVLVDSKESIEKQLTDGEYASAIELTVKNNVLFAEVISFDPLQLTKQQTIAAQLDNVSKWFTIAQSNLSEQQAMSILNAKPQITLKTLNDESVGGKTAAEKQAGIGASYAAGFFIYLFVISFLSIVTTDVASEKGSRALEMLLVSVRPETHFSSKVISIFLVAITQILIIAAVVFSIFKLKGDSEHFEEVKQVLHELSGTFIVYVFLFLFITILLFLIMGALFGSLVSKVEESSQVMAPATIILVIGFYVMVSAVKNPDTMLIKIFSYIPFTSGMVMPMRIGGTDLSPIEPLLSLGVLILCTIILYYTSLRFYKRSVLTYTTGSLLQKVKTVFKVTT